MTPGQALATYNQMFAQNFAPAVQPSRFALELAVQEREAAAAAAAREQAMTFELEERRRVAEEEYAQRSTEAAAAMAAWQARAGEAANKAASLSNLSEAERDAIVTQLAASDKKIRKAGIQTYADYRAARAKGQHMELAGSIDAAIAAATAAKIDSNAEELKSLEREQSGLAQSIAQLGAKYPQAYSIAGQRAQQRAMELGQGGGTSGDPVMSAADEEDAGLGEDNPLAAALEAGGAATAKGGGEEPPPPKTATPEGDSDPNQTWTPTQLRDGNVSTRLSLPYASQQVDKLVDSISGKINPSTVLDFADWVGASPIRAAEGFLTGQYNPDRRVSDIYQSEVFKPFFAAGGKVHDALTRMQPQEPIVLLPKTAAQIRSAMNLPPLGTEITEEEANAARADYYNIRRPVSIPITYPTPPQPSTPEARPMVFPY